MAVIDTDNLTPETIQALQALLQTGAQQGRSPIPMPLKDLRAPTTARGRLHRPHFEWSADEAQMLTPLGPFPMLRWDEMGVEHAIQTAEALATVPAHWTPHPPVAAPMSELERLQQEFASLSEEDRKFLLETQRKQKLERLQSAMSALPASALSQFQSAAEVVEMPKATKKDKAEKTA